MQRMIFVLAVCLLAAAAGGIAAVEYEAALICRVGVKPEGICASDLDGDGDIDLAVANFDSEDISVILSNGDGTFQPAVPYGVTAGAMEICAEDLDGDGDPDLAVATYFYVGVGASILINRGDGTFENAVAYEAGAPGRYSICAADFDGDGDGDLAVTNNDDSVAVLLNNGDGTFGDAVSYAAGAGKVRAADLDGDGSIDLTMTGSGSILTMQGNGDGTFQPPVAHAAGDTPIAVCISDLDGDGSFDLVAANPLSGEVTVLLNNGDGTFAGAAFTACAGSFFRYICSADLDADGNSDLAVGDYMANDVKVLLNKGDATFPSAPSYAVAGEWDQVGRLSGADFDGDGNEDLAVLNWDTYAVLILMGSGDGTFPSSVEYVVGYFPTSVCVSDLDEDSEADLVVTGTGGISLLFGNGDGTFQDAVSYHAGTYTIWACASDVDGDGDRDLAVTNRDTDDVSILLNNGDGTFVDAGTYAVGDGPYGISEGDFDDDGRVDLAVADFHSDDVAILMGNGDGTFGAATFWAQHDAPAILRTSDFDGDGDVDLAVTNVSVDALVDELAIMRNNGKGQFNSIRYYETGEDPMDINIEDLDWDGDEDLLIPYSGLYNGGVMVMINDGSGSFESLASYAAGDGPQSVRAADLDSDGDIDLAVSNRSSSDVSILINLVFTLTAVEEDVSLPRAAHLSGNYPNPFNPVTTVRFSVPRPGHVRIAVYDIAGRRVAVLVDRLIEPGEFTAHWDGRDESGRAVASGVYFARMTMEGFSEMRKMVLLR